MLSIVLNPDFQDAHLLCLTSAIGKSKGLTLNSAYSLSLARYYRHPLGVNFLSESIQRDAFFRNVLLDQE